MYASMTVTVVGIVALMFLAASIERLVEAWTELTDTFRRMAADVE